MPIIHPVVNISNSSSSNTMVNTHNSNINSSTLLKAMALLINIMQLCNEMCVTEWAVQFNHKAFCVTRAVVTLCHHHHINSSSSSNTIRRSKSEQVWGRLITRLRLLF